MCPKIKCRTRVKCVVVNLVSVGLICFLINLDSCFSSSSRYHQLLIGVLWQIVVNSEAIVRSSAAPLFTVGFIMEYIVHHE